MHLLDLAIKMQTKSRNNIYASKQAQAKVQNLLIDMKMLGERETERYDNPFSSYKLTRKLCVL